ncbi:MULTISPECIES: sodium:calcium exchanger [Pontibacter]|uniref:Sodium:calcium exchanger n=1 Tax=Pontibacter actiniarum TaxID=323450 RepID=A0A1X9YYK7_9BACT|nr:sodium:calcium exchanger [Pontibacter actiniarum]ARS38060.1 sodium:calcium exchanger [Pontibacter actiniarum]
MSVWIWVLVLIAAIWAAQWGAEHLAKPLKKLRKQWGFSVAAGGALVGVAAASPEIGINIASAVTGVADIGLGTMFGSNVIAIPFMVVTAYIATRHLKKGNAGKDHEQHVKEHLLKVDHTAVTVQALPYLVIVAVVAILTVPAQWRGLQPTDGWIMLGVYLVYLAQALLRGRKEGEKVEWKKKEIYLAVAGLVALGLGAFFTVKATENIVAALGISKIVGGLFITAPMAALPEIFATWSVAKTGQITSAVTSVIGDHAVTMTVAFLPLALVTVPVKDLTLYITILSFAGLVGILYSAFIHWGGKNGRHGFNRWQVYTLGAVVPVYVGVMLFGVLQVFGGPSGEGANLFKVYNEDKNDYLEDGEFYKAVAKIGYFETWNQDGDASLSEEEWRAGISENLGGYKVNQIEELGEWDLNGDSQISEEEFREGLFEAVDKDGNRQISESEFVSLYREGIRSQKGK